MKELISIIKELYPADVKFVMDTIDVLKDKYNSIKEGSSNMMGSFLFFFQQLLHIRDLFVQMSVDLQVSLHNPLHLCHIVIDVVVNSSNT